MRFSLLAVIAALTSADITFALCNSVVAGCAILRTRKITKSWHVARVSHVSAFVLELFMVRFLVTC
ncbi:uncharacterized protein BJ212DRAFT_1325540 [Suillus subaureus]|uniref:Secreted protein n=1 Tax=Suillus subaureus TaxID=48587 RepID=A0A9P7JHK8_9AGAM|nr:uncharacterized protein BJ212DRAFT_1325540 [Suillus subaureus]KAG1823616.1 hypothetical protein BJ212DRAFT_1325540 [Suillus subaureus]